MSIIDIIGVAVIIALALWIAIKSNEDRWCHQPTADRTTTPPKRPTDYPANMVGSTWFSGYDPPSETGAYRVIVGLRRPNGRHTYKTLYLGYSVGEGWRTPGGCLREVLWQPLDVT